MIEVRPTAPRTAERPPPTALQVALRAMTVVAGLIAIACTRAATGEPLPALEVIVLMLSIVCAITSDGHVGLLAVVIIGINWVVGTDDTETPLVIGVASAVAVLHTSMSAAAVAPASARWTPAMRRRWRRRFLVQMAVIVPTWALVVVVARVEIGASAVVMAAALLIVGVAGLWARHGGLRRDPPDRLST